MEETKFIKCNIVFCAEFKALLFYKKKKKEKLRE